MPDGIAVTAATAIAQIVSAGVIALVLYGFYQQYRKTYLLHWTLSWIALIGYLGGTHAAMAMSQVGAMPANHPARIAVALIGTIAGLLNVVWLVFGVHEVVNRRPIRLAYQRRILLAAAAVGVVTVLATLSPELSSGLRFTARVGIRAIAACAAFAFAAFSLWEARWRRKGVGFTILAVSLFAYSAEQLHYVSLGFSWIFTGTQSNFAFYVGYLDFVLQGIMGMGMVASLLEEEREAAELATLQVEHLAYHDALTGLPNRPLFSDRLIIALAQATRAGHRLAVLFLDLDRFKEINDSLGHSLGDALLKAVAERIRHCTREGDTVARFGGDEFTVLIPKIEHIEDVAKIAEKINATLRMPFLINDRELFITTSIGISIFPADGSSPELLVRNADTAMYRAKEHGRDNYQLYAPAMNARALERLSLENALRKAVDHNEFVLHYQPVVDLRTYQVVAVEALVRWRHPELGLLLPSEFIHVAELSGVILPLGDWVLQTACRKIHTWHRRNDIRVAVNLSPRQFQQPDIVEQLRRVVEGNDIDPSRLQIEVTEGSAMQHAENTIHVLRELKDIGIRLAIDDFGTGYSSLSYLKQFPIDTLKLDSSFVRDIATDDTDSAIARAVIDMAHSLGIDVVAEGVELQSQLDVLVRHGCDLVQGYHFSRPLDAEDLESYLATHVEIVGPHRVRGAGVPL